MRLKSDFRNFDLTQNDTAPGSAPDYSSLLSNVNGALSRLTGGGNGGSGGSGGGNSNGGQLKSVYDQIVNYKPFNYNINEDMLYKQYADQYQNLGRLAMQDTMGQAAALTGGYGNTYGQAVGQQQYDAYLQQLNQMLPDFYGAAYQRHQDDYNALLNKYQFMKANGGGGGSGSGGVSKKSTDAITANTDKYVKALQDYYSKKNSTGSNQLSIGTEALDALKTTNDLGTDGSQLYDIPAAIIKVRNLLNNVKK